MVNNNQVNHKFMMRDSVSQSIWRSVAIPNVHVHDVTDKESFERGLGATMCEITRLYDVIPYEIGTVLDDVFTYLAESPIIKSKDSDISIYDIRRGGALLISSNGEIHLTFVGMDDIPPCVKVIPDGIRGINVAEPPTKVNICTKIKHHAELLSVVNQHNTDMYYGNESRSSAIRYVLLFHSTPISDINSVE